MRGYERIVWVVAGVWVLLAATPASLWYNAGTVYVEDSVSGTPPSMIYRGGPVRDFKGNYKVILRDAATEKTVYESESGVFGYRTGVERGDIDLKWWAPLFEYPLPPGTYFIETCWTVHQPFWGLVPNKNTCTDDSNIFDIFPADVLSPSQIIEQQSYQLQEQSQAIEELKLEVQTLSQDTERN